MMLFKWFISSCLEKLSRLLYPLTGQCIFINSVAHSKRSFLLCSALKKHKRRYDLVIAHNLPALYPAYKYAKENKIPFAFDIEDFHPEEKIDVDVENEKGRRIFLLQKLLPFAIYVSYASPLIGDATLKTIPDKSNLTHFLINNSFPSREFVQPLENKYKKLQLVWFSQNIAAGRGLEIFIPVLFEFKDSIQLTLIGNLSASFHNTFLKKYSELINYRNPMLQESLHRLLSEFDVGLAIESVSADFNRELCLTNKIFAYAQAGLYILATNTKGQFQFIDQYPWSGELVGYSSKEIRVVVENLIAQKDLIRRSALERFHKSKVLAWDLEQVKLENVWKSII
jgi:hypothetical protein